MNGINVLIDGFNLELTQGTGIKTYSISLIKALKCLGANVSVLFSCSKGSKDPILNEVLFFDRHINKSNKYSRIKTVIKALGPSFVAQEVKRKGIVIKSGEMVDVIGVQWEIFYPTSLT